MLETPVAAELPGVRGDGAQVRHNRRRAAAVAASPALVVLVVALAVGAAAGAVLVGIVVGVVAGLAVWSALWWGATRFVLRSLGARPGDDAELARAENLVDGLCASMGVDAPEILVVDDALRDALALGRTGDDATLVVTTGLLEALDPVALEGVIAHELVHLKRGDIAPATMAAAIGLPLAALAPVGGLVHTLAGRGREFDTDRLAAAVTRFPPGLRDALVVMAEGPGPRTSSPLAARRVVRATAWLWTVALPETPDTSMLRVGAVGELDAPATRIAALDEW